MNNTDCRRIADLLKWLHKKSVLEMSWNELELKVFLQELFGVAEGDSIYQSYMFND